MKPINAIIFKESPEHGELVVEFTDGITSMDYFFNTSRDGREVLNCMPQCLKEDINSKDLYFPGEGGVASKDIELRCEDAYADLIEKFNNDQVIAIFYALYNEYIPSDLDVLISALEMRLAGRRPIQKKGPSRPTARRW